ncbi:MAG: hypothetical protein FWF79_06670 [Defluviitaleaceae bacterium]|nr:hypothetical protein [Defluviitaleaceae bacterium]
MKKTSFKLLVLLLMVAVLSVGAITVLAVNRNGDYGLLWYERSEEKSELVVEQSDMPVDKNIAWGSRETIDYSILTATLNDSIGAFGFEEGFDDKPYEIIEIAVQFRTPPAVAASIT